MTLIEGIKHKGRPFEIPSCSRNDLPQFFIDMGFKRGVEIGVDRGEYSELFCKVGLNHYAIDPWLSYPGYRIGGPQHKVDALYEDAKSRLSPYSNCTIIRKTSMDALQDFEDNSLDYVYLDGNHYLKYIVEDLCGWTAKVKVGGIVSGHDYMLTKDNTYHIVYALKAYLNAHGYEHWYVLGLLREDNRDRWRSWMFIKK